MAKIAPSFLTQPVYPAHVILIFVLWGTCVCLWLLVSQITLTCIIIFSRLDYCNSVFVVVLQNAHTLSAHPKLFSSGMINRPDHIDLTRTNSSASASHTSLLHSLHRSLVVLIILSQYDQSISLTVNLLVWRQKRVLRPDRRWSRTADHHLTSSLCLQ